MKAGLAASARIVFVTAANEAQALSIAQALVSERLAAYADIMGPIRSIYRWHDEVQDDREHLIMAKTRASLVPSLERRIKQLHSYEVPEVIAVSASAGSRPYLKWLMESTGGPARKRRL